MKSGLSKISRAGGIFDTVTVDVYCLKTKKVVFTGSLQAAGAFVGTSGNYIHPYLKNKIKYKKKYCFRYAKENQNP